MAGRSNTHTLKVELSVQQLSLLANMVNKLMLLNPEKNIYLIHFLRTNFWMT